MEGNIGPSLPASQVGVLGLAAEKDQTLTWTGDKLLARLDHPLVQSPDGWLVIIRQSEIAVGLEPSLFSSLIQA